MDPQRERIQDDLRGLVTGVVRCDDVFLQLYASDASIYQIKPLGVVRPVSTADVVACLKYASENQLPVIPRGAGSGLAGECLGAGLILDFSSHMRRILETGETTVRAQPGVVLERLNNHLRSQGRMFGPDPAMSHVTTLGSVVAIDAGGSHWLRYGSAGRHVRRLQAVLADGTVIEASRDPGDGDLLGSTESRYRQLLEGLAQVLEPAAETIRRQQPKAVVNRCGYHLAGVLDRGRVDLLPLLVGSEGTLAVITDVTLDTVPVPRHQGAALLLFHRLEDAARAVQEILPSGPSACDLMDRRHLGLARESDARYDSLIPAETEALLLVEFQGDAGTDVRDRLRQVVDRSRLRGSTRAVPIVEDIAIPPELLSKFLVDMQNVLKRHQVTATLFGHAGQGQLHLRPFLDLDNPEHVRTLKLLADDLYESVWKVGGTISGEHGDGLSRTPFIPQQYGDLYPVFQAVKQVFDPAGILNPGKKVAAVPTGENATASRPLLAAALRPMLTPAGASLGGPPLADPREFVPLQLTWTAGQIANVARDCNGCGACRAQDPSVRMCPMFRFAPGEEASPRAKANLIRGILSGQLDPRTMEGPEFKAVADLCVNCQMCRLECPAGVDIPKLMIEAKAAHVASNGIPTSDWILTRLDLFSPIGGLLSPLANWALGNRQARWLLEKVAGIAQGRKLPRFAARSFLRRAHRRRLTRPPRQPGRKILYFVDTYANHHDPQIGEALVRILEHNGLAVYVHPGQTQSGMAMVSLGSIDQARRVATRNVALLAEAIRQGYTILASEPSAALCLTREYPSLLDEDDARLVAANTREACDFLWELHLAGKLHLDFKPVNASLGYHLPCHVMALEVGTPGENLLRLIPGLTVQRIEKGCSGMAGMFGLKRENYRASLRAGWPLISAVREASWQAGATECSACKIQMEQGTSKPTLHPLLLVALAYGLMPEVAGRLTARGQELVVT